MYKQRGAISEGTFDVHRLIPIRLDLDQSRLFGRQLDGGGWVIVANYQRQHQGEQGAHGEHG